VKFDTSSHLLAQSPEPVATTNRAVQRPCCSNPSVRCAKCLEPEAQRPPHSERYAIKHRNCMLRYHRDEVSTDGKVATCSSPPTAAPPAVDCFASLLAFSPPFGLSRLRQSARRSAGKPHHTSRRVEVFGHPVTSWHRVQAAADDLQPGANAPCCSAPWCAAKCLEPECSTSVAMCRCLNGRH
jgi:hypothetical protein